MTESAGSVTALPPCGPAVVAMVSVLLASALSVHVIPTVGSAGIALA